VSKKSVTNYQFHFLSFFPICAQVLRAKKYDFIQVLQKITQINVLSEMLGAMAGSTNCIVDMFHKENVFF